MSKATIIENLEVLLATVEAQPEERFSLDIFCKPTPCGTLFCTLGLACTLPRFQVQGLELVPFYGYKNNLSYDVYMNNDSISRKEDVLDDIFGDKSYYNVFASTVCGNFDHDLGYNLDDPDCMTHKELAIARLKRQIKMVKGTKQ